MRLLEAYAWPGNVRELENLIERTVALEPSDVITTASLPDTFLHPAGLPPASSLEGFDLPADGLDLEAYLEWLGKRLMQQALERTGGVQIRAAELLRMSERSFRYYAKKYGIRRDGEETPDEREAGVRRRSRSRDPPPRRRLPRGPSRRGACSRPATSPAAPAGSPRRRRLPARASSCRRARRSPSRSRVTDPEKAQGLMFRESMPTDAGMVFLFDGLEIRPFWMKNCHFPLDIVYATKDGTVVDVLEERPALRARSRARAERRAEGESRHRPRGQRGRRRRERRRPGREAEVGGDSGTVSGGVTSYYVT